MRKLMIFQYLPRAIYLSVFLFTFSNTYGAVTIDVLQMPSLKGIEELSALPPAEAAESIQNALRKSYQPSKGLQAGSATRPAFIRWMRLAQWFTLLSQTDQAELARFLSSYLAFTEKDGKQQLLYRLPGTSFSADTLPLAEEHLQECVSTEKSRQIHLTRYVPKDFVWKNSILQEYLGKELAATLAANPVFLEDFFTILSSEDFTPEVMQNLSRLYQHNSQKFLAYSGLVLALSVVFDQNPPPDWPHHQVKEISLLKNTQTIEERFDFWIQSQEKMKLITDLKKIGADQLTFMVDTLVPASELTWAQEKMKLPRATFDKAFSSIRYDHPRIGKQQFAWPKEIPYTLENIQKHGGICVDQAYFAMMAGKGRGIPTLLFVGQGVDGGHAWFGYLVGDDRWNVNAGRYENQKYAVGSAINPQTWGNITDHELKFLTERVRKTAKYQSGLLDMIMAEDFLQQGDIARASAAVDSAIELSPQNPKAWDAKTKLLTTKGASNKERVAHFEAACKNFLQQKDLQAFYQKELAKEARATGDEKLALGIEQRVVQQNRLQRADISVTAASEKLSSLLEAGKTQEAMQEFRLQSNRLGNSVGGSFFYEMVSPLIKYLISNKQFREAQQVLDIAKRQLHPDRGSILDQALAKLDREINASKSNH